MPKGSLEIIEFEPRRAIPEAAVTHNPPAPNDHEAFSLEPRTVAKIAAGLGSLTLHAFLLTPVILGVVAAPTRPPDQPYAGNAAMQWVVLTDSPSTPHGAASSFSPPFLVPIAMPQAVPGLPPEPVTAAHSKGNPDQAGLAALYGRYTGQMHARIERVWQRPRTSPGGASFRCQVEVDQDKNGRVGEVALIDCDGDTRWRLSLVRAIEAASPLPAPPAAAVFAHRVLLSFVATPYAPGAPAQLYEPVGEADKARSEAGLRVLQNTFRSPRAASQSDRAHKVIEIRIDGSIVEIEQKSQRQRK